MSATSGLEGILLWDILGKGFLKQVLELSMCNYALLLFSGLNNQSGGHGLDNTDKQPLCIQD